MAKAVRAFTCPLAPVRQDSVRVACPWLAQDKQSLREQPQAKTRTAETVLHRRTVMTGCL